jgi:hypothetical protein
MVCILSRLGSARSTRTRDLDIGLRRVEQKLGQIFDVVRRGSIPERGNHGRCFGLWIGISKVLQ